MPDRSLAIPAIAAALGADAARFDIAIVDECGSTNTLLLERAAVGAPSGSVIAARRQTAGRGRMGRVWHGDEVASLPFSLLWRLPAGRAPGGLSLAVGVAVAEALRAFDVDGIALKWPNDLLRHGRKLGGILVELAGGAVVIGVGLNLRNPAGLPDEVARLAAAIDREIDRNALLASLLIRLRDALDEFGATGFAAFGERWRKLDAHAGRPVRIVSEFAPPVEGVSAGVDADGALLLRTANGVERILSGDVSLRIADGP